jgi:hypothetical protein
MCRLCEILYALLPFPPLRGWLLRKHMAECPRCSRDLVPGEQAALAAADIPHWIKREPSLWPRVRAEILVPPAGPGSAKVRSGTPGFVHWRYAVAALGLALFIAANILIQHRFAPPPGPAAHAVAASSITVNFAEVKGKKARHHIYQTSSTSYIWFVQGKDGEGE